MSTWNNYFLAHTIDEAVQTLAASEGQARPIGGGTDLLLEIQQGRHQPVKTLVDITNIPELKCFEKRGDFIFIGAGVAVKTITESPLIKHHAPAVSEACGLIGGPQVRNTATIGGNVAHALPAADGMISLFAFDTMVEIASPDGMRQQPFASLFRGPGISTLKENEILVGFYLPVRELNTGSAFSRIMRPQGVALPIINMAVWLKRQQHIVADIHIAIGPSGPVPVRATAAENVLKGCPLSEDGLNEAKNAIHETIKFRTSAMRASADYRHHLSEVLLDEVIGKAWQRAAEPLED